MARRSSLAVLVAAGGALGAAGREAVSQALPAGSGLPVATLLINLSGTFVLGVLLESLVRAGPDTDCRRAVRLGGGTGVLGGFTTYSTFSLESVQLVRHGRPALAVVYVLLTVVGGLMAAALGVVLAAGVSGRRVARRVAVDPDL